MPINDNTARAAHIDSIDRIDRRLALKAAAATAAGLGVGHWLNASAWAAPEGAGTEAAVGAAPAGLRTLSGEAPGVAGKDGATAESLAARLGRSGCWVVRNKERWADLQDTLAAFGWKRPEGHALAEPDFDREVIVGVFFCGEPDNRLAVRKVGGQLADLDVTMSYVIYKQRLRTPLPVCRFLFTALPARKSFSVAVSTFHPMNGGKHQDADNARLEWHHEFAADSGDVVDGLEARITPRNGAVKKGDDIAATFELRFVPAAKVRGGAFADAPEPAIVHVWDGKYSEGYRNHSFLVRKPDGSAVLLRPAVIDQWEKNAPHPEPVAEGKPYVLPNWAEGSKAKSLRALGLAADAPGEYRITGVYEESSRSGEHMGPKQAMWGGRIASAPVTVTVEG
jgi:hypothetical protein